MKHREEVEARQDARILDVLEGEKISPFGVRFDPVQGGGAERLRMIRESFIREMTRLAITHNAINLSQGFPDFDPPREAIEAAHDALESGGNQYTITGEHSRSDRPLQRKWTGGTGSGSILTSI